MSRTDRHRPWHVQADDRFEQRFYWFDQGTPKHGWRKVFTFRECNCRNYWCGGGWRKAENRQRRQQAKRQCHAARKGDYRACD